ncbi:MAG: cellulose binding domain-containing protein [Candidatus Binatia bacterium]
MWGSEPGATSTATPAPTATVASTATPRPTATVAPTATPTPRPTATPTPAPTQTPRPTATAAPTTTPTPTRTPAPTPTSAASATPVPTPSGLTASVTIQSSWQSGYCAGITIRNAGTTAKQPRVLRFRLDPSVAITSSWNGTVKRSSDVVDVALPSWVATLAPRASSTDFGFCTNGTTRPTQPSAG